VRQLTLPRGQPRLRRKRVDRSARRPARPAERRTDATALCRTRSRRGLHDL